MMLTHATITGRAHRLHQTNCHDFALTGSGATECVFGLVLDGCGSKFREGPDRHGPHSEVGAKLLGRFAANWLAGRLCVECDVCALAAALPVACEGFLQSMVQALSFRDEAARKQFIATHLLTTLVGFMLTPQAATFFWLGDGYLCLNGQVTALDSDNRPDYLAYCLLEQTRPVIQVQAVNRAEIEWLAVATDGWSPDLLAAVDPAENSLALQRRLRVWARMGGHFEDDGAIAVAKGGAHANALR